MKTCRLACFLKSKKMGTNKVFFCFTLWILLIITSTLIFPQIVIAQVESSVSASGIKPISGSDSASFDAPFNIDQGFGVSFPFNVKSEVIVSISGPTSDSFSLSGGVSIGGTKTLRLAKGKYTITEKYILQAISISKLIDRSFGTKVSFDPVTYEVLVEGNKTIEVRGEAKSVSISIMGDFTGVSSLSGDTLNVFVSSLRKIPKGQILSFSVKVSADYSKSISIAPLNAPPVLTSVSIKSSDGDKAFKTSTLIASAVGSDPDGDQISYKFQWLKNGAEIAGATGETLSGVSFNKNDVISVRAVAFDGKTPSQPKVSNEIKVSPILDLLDPIDVNQDGIVDIFDLVLIVTHFGENFTKKSASPSVRANPKVTIQLVASSEKARESQDSNVILLKVKLKSLSNLIKDRKDNIDLRDIGGFQFDLAFDLNLLQVEKVQEGKALKSSGKDTFWIKPRLTKGGIFGVASVAVDSNFRESSASLSTFDNSYSDADADEELAIITFKLTGELLKALESIHLIDLKLSDRFGNPIEYIISNQIEIQKNKAIVDRSALFQNFPNPFNPETWIPYQLANPAGVSIKIYDISGRLIKTLNLGGKDVGLYTSKERAAYWDGRNDVGEYVADGIYFYEFVASNFRSIKKMVILK